MFPSKPSSVSQATDPLGAKTWVETRSLSWALFLSRQRACPWAGRLLGLPALSVAGPDAGRLNRFRRTTHGTAPLHHQPFQLQTGPAREAANIRAQIKLSNRLKVRAKFISCPCLPSSFSKGHTLKGEITKENEVNPVEG